LRRRWSAPGRWVSPALGLALFLLVLGGTFLWALPRDVLLTPVRSALAGTGADVSAGDVRLRFPLALRLTDAVVTPPGGPPVPLDAVTVGWDFTGLRRGLPGHLRLTRGGATVDVLTSARLWSPRRGRLRIESLSSDDLAALLPEAASGAAFAIREAAAQWTATAPEALSGSGTGLFDRLAIPVPAQGSPVREVVLDNVVVRFTLREGDVQISSLAGTYEGSRVDGTGVIAGIRDPARATITFHIRIHNPLEGKVAVLFNMLAKNAKNANLRITGTLLSPKGEFQFF
jgi:hypothetical protein